MTQTRAQLRMEVRRNLGHPFVKVELCDDHINDAIDRARDMWIKWAVGNATQETWMTLMLKDGHWIYNLPTGVTEVVDYYDGFGSGGGMGSNHTFNTGGPQVLFSLDNAMYMGGFINTMGGAGGGGLNAGYMPGTYIGGGGGMMGMYNPVSYVLAQQFMGDLEHYHVNKYRWKYHRSTNQLELQPMVPCNDSQLTLTTDLSGNYKIYDNIDCSSFPTTATVFTSPGFILLRTYMVEGASLPTYVPPTSGDIKNSIFDIADSYSEWLFSEVWIREYVTALCMITLGRIRRKFAGFSSLGNQGISMDGADLISEGQTEKDRLEAELNDKHAYEGYGITIG